MRAMRRAEAKRQKKVARAQTQLRAAYEDPEHLAALDLPEDMPDEALDIMAEAEAQLRTKYRPNPATISRYGLQDTPLGGSL